MRKDVKIGVGIGGVLLAVLIVYLLVPKTDGTRQFSQNDTSNTGGNGGSGDGSQASSVPDVTVTGGTNTGVPSSGESASSGAGATETARSEPGVNGAGADTETRAEGGVNVDWTTILETGIVKATPLMATRPEPVDPFGDSQKMPPTDRGPEPVWPQGGPSQPLVTHPGSTGATGQPGGQSPTTPAGQTGGTRTAISEHVVQQNETLSSIALAAYGDARLYKEILKANPTLDERKMRPGTKLKIPDAATFKQAQTAEHRQPAAAVNAKSEYRVTQDDNLTRIAVKLYGKPGRANELYELNKEVIGPDSSKLKLGMVLKLPAAPGNTPVSSR